jgi:hypothetical protein
MMCNKMPSFLKHVPIVNLFIEHCDHEIEKFYERKHGDGTATKHKYELKNWYQCCFCKREEWSWIA